MPRISSGTGSPFTPEGDRSAALIGVAIEGQFNSFFADKENPLLADTKTPAADGADKDAADAAKEKDKPKNDAGVITGIIDKSPESALVFVQFTVPIGPDVVDDRFGRRHCVR
jgi:ABC-2 type transport system permease protein